MRVVVIGGGAAGFFTAINIAEKTPKATITLLERSNKLLHKVQISGGGRCNVTNARTKPSELVPFYPRGNKKLYPAFKKFSSDDMRSWLAHRGVAIKAEEDHRCFPISDSSQTIIDCFVELADKYSIRILKQQTWTDLVQYGREWIVITKEERIITDFVIVATGSSPSSWKILERIGLKVTKPVPSLFTFRINDSRIKELQGISFPAAQVKVAGTKLQEEGALLITHWGLSGPAVLKLSSWGAYQLEEIDYQFKILINFISKKPEAALGDLMRYKQQNAQRTVSKYPMWDVPRRFWERMLENVLPNTSMCYAELSKKHVNKIVEELTQGMYQVTGKSAFKEEFVTAGGIHLSEIDLTTYEAKRFPGLFAVGEVMDIDALTGGFNFQACWTGGWIISEYLSKTVLDPLTQGNA
ncbi:MAG: NAD(P)/FAD-dependent oxidoreductase [Bacteroidota bacterium]